MSEPKPKAPDPSTRISLESGMINWKKGLTMTQTRLNPSHKCIAQRNSIQNQKEKQILTWTSGTFFKHQEV